MPDDNNTYQKPILRCSASGMQVGSNRPLIGSAIRPIGGARSLLPTGNSVPLSEAEVPAEARRVTRSFSFDDRVNDIPSVIEMMSVGVIPSTNPKRGATQFVTMVLADMDKEVKSVLVKELVKAGEKRGAVEVNGREIMLTLGEQEQMQRVLQSLLGVLKHHYAIAHAQGDAAFKQLNVPPQKER